ncbi:hypothetical protein BDN71DRAFT_665043 [Pleurotus eryngii]|uniref:Uncharacterized protein n=1 Tax=Pleurotus eryngii TaxID=5323 RepID=A0A9P5ZHN5_PLEER|nr:hypothetical protein BDN71DRAFT_665043 [Pleurotus eryngii]
MQAYIYLYRSWRELHKLAAELELFVTGVTRHELLRTKRSPNCLCTYHLKLEALRFEGLTGNSTYQGDDRMIERIRIGYSAHSNAIIDHLKPGKLNVRELAAHMAYIFLPLRDRLVPRAANPKALRFKRRESVIVRDPLLNYPTKAVASLWRTKL